MSVRASPIKLWYGVVTAIAVWLVLAVYVGSVVVEQTVMKLEKEILKCMSRPKFLDINDKDQWWDGEQWRNEGSTENEVARSELRKLNMTQQMR